MDKYMQLGRNALSRVRGINLPRFSACKMANVLFLVAVAILGLGVLLHIIGLATPEWSTSKTTSYTIGPFEACTADTCVSIDSDILDDKYRAVQAMVIIGMLASFVALAMALIHVIMGVLGKNQMKLMPILSAAFSIVALVFILIGVIIWGAEIHIEEIFDIGYSFALSIVGAVLIAVGGIMFFVLGKS